ncbi:hypothetical protein NMG60_11022610 [Bertholletia excelsa]
MKFMRIGTRPDSFYTEEATRTVTSDLPVDLIIQINKISYLLHKHQLLPKCCLLQRLCLESENFDESGAVSLNLHDFPGGKEAFELCAKFCYGIMIDLGAHNIVAALSAAKFLQMTEAVDKGNLVLKLETFFNSCILEGWKDSVVTLQSTAKLPEWSENLGIIRRCIDSIIQKILTPCSKVAWSFTYTRPGYARKRRQHVPKDWWTEDIAELDIDTFRCIITAVRSANMLPPQLIGEALHVYTCRWLPDHIKALNPESSSTARTEKSMERKQRILETISSTVPPEKGSVSTGFLFRLLSMANLLGLSPVTKADLIRRCSLQLEEATVNDLLFPSQSSTNSRFYDVELVGAVVESFLVRWRRQTREDERQSMALIQKVGKLVDCYLQVVAREVNMPVGKLVSLAKALPEFARPVHDDLYKAIDIYLKVHPDLGKEDKKSLCRILNCQKLSPEVSAQAVMNEHLPLRTVVQVLFFEQERSSRPTSHKLPPQNLILNRQRPVSTGGDDMSNLKLSWDEKLQLERKQEDVEKEKGRVSKAEGTSGSKLDPSKMLQMRSKSDKGRTR